MRLLMQVSEVALAREATVPESRVVERMAVHQPARKSGSQVAHGKSVTGCGMRVAARWGALTFGDASRSLPFRRRWSRVFFHGLTGGS